MEETEKLSKEDMAAIRERVFQVIEKCEAGHKLNFSKRIKHSTGNVDTWINPKNRVIPSFRAIRNIGTEYRINLNWLVLGEGSMYLFETEKSSKEFKKVHDENEKLKAENNNLKGQLTAYEKMLGKPKK